jgi:hypothetical protein
LFSIPEKSFISLKIFDVLGNEITTLISDELEAGNYSETWTATDYINGVYFYRLESAQYQKTKKMILLK